VRITNGDIIIENDDGDTTGIMHNQDKGVSIQSYGGDKISSLTLKNDGTAGISGATGGIYFHPDGPAQISASKGLQITVRTTKTGKAEFSDGTYLEFQDGF